MSRLKEYLEAVGKEHPTGGYIYKSLDLCFKYLQWITLVALVQSASKKVDSGTLYVIAKIAHTAIVLSMSESVTKLINSFIQLSPNSKSYIFYAAAIFSVVVSIFISITLQKYVGNIIDDFLKIEGLR